ncbi:hypothetical protein KKD03_03930 [Patescibacteria group bacterium]|nr:hypothetical protein [Patescibacteria group bacterium]
MLNTEKLLYILPDLTYLAELLPGKKEHTYAIQSFKQINGNFLDDNEFISANIQKLFTKVDKEEYHLILPDFLFTDTIVNVDDESMAGALAHVKDKLLPTLNLTDETHEIEITVLNSFKGKSRVQISAIEKELLAPVRVAAEKSKTIIKAVSPLSWAIKSIVSLEPSITVLQIGSNLYSSQHYIGIDQTNNFPVNELSSIVETIKTLKGAEPSIQTIYLASSSLIEEKFKEELGGTLPIQQLATYKEEDSKMPSYVKYIIESSMRTLSLPNYPVPKFKLGKASKEEEAIVDSAETTEKNDKVETDKELNSKNTAPTDLPEPSKVPELMTAAKVKDVINMPKTNILIEEPSEKEIEEVKNEFETVGVKVSDDTKDKVKKVNSETRKSDLNQEIAEINEETSKTKDEATDNKKEKLEDKNEVNLAQFAGKDNGNEDEKVKSETTEPKNLKKVIKNSSGVNNMLKMVFITLAVFFITIAIGIGVGLGLLKMSDKNPNQEITPVVVTDPEVTLEPTATPEPVVEINKEDLSILVVNATSKAGYAGKIKTLLIEAEIPKAIAGNAEGEYDEGTDYILMTKENTQLEKLLEDASSLDLEYSSGIEIEDPDDDYDAVLVLSK